MENILLKKSFHAKNFKLLKFNPLWGYKGIFTTIRLFGKEPNFILVDQHLKKLNKDFINKIKTCFKEKIDPKFFHKTSV